MNMIEYDVNNQSDYRNVDSVCPPEGRLLIEARSMILFQRMSSIPWLCVTALLGML